MKKVEIEICVDSLESAKAAQEGGANRVELCSGLNEGGLTPSAGLIDRARNNIEIDINVLIRPRSGDFLYSDSEFELIIFDIEIAKKLGANGIVIGFLLKNGEIDVERTKRIVEIAKPMNVTFHRAFDMCQDPIIGLEDVIKTGVDRLLSAGQRTNVGDNLPLLKEIINIANDRIIIMPGGGLNINNIETIHSELHASEYHASLRVSRKSQMIYRNNLANLGSNADNSEYETKITDSSQVIKFINILNES